MIATNRLGIEIFSLDTGRLFDETLELLDRTESKYRIRIKLYYPGTSSVEQLVAAQGINGFYNSVENRKNCCYVRKVEPLKRALAGNSIWITGLRAEQSANRSGISASHSGRSTTLRGAAALIVMESPVDRSTSNCRKWNGRPSSSIASPGRGP